MCGRIACTLDPDNLCCATACKNVNSNYFIKTIQLDSVRNIKPSYNVPPTVAIPVIVSSEHRDFNNEESGERLLVSMRFGILAPWMKQQNSKFSHYETHLCKIERVRESKLYNPLLKGGNRCAVPCLGYYEWQTVNKQPYFFYHKNNSSSVLTSTQGSFDPDKGWSGPQLLYLAGLYNTYLDDEGNKAYSLAIITKETDEEWKFVHHRMPVVLQTDSDVNMWIKSKTHPVETAFELLTKTITNLAAHPVDKSVINNTRNNVPKCVEKFNPDKPVNTFMKSWLGSSGKKSNNSSVSEAKNQKKKSSESPKTKRTALDDWLNSSSKKVKKR